MHYSPQARGSSLPALSTVTFSSFFTPRTAVPLRSVAFPLRVVYRKIANLQTRLYRFAFDVSPPANHRQKQQVAWVLTAMSRANRREPGAVWAYRDLQTRRAALISVVTWDAARETVLN